MTLKALVGTRGQTAPTDLGTCVTGLVNAVARGMAQIVSAHGLTHIDFALLRLFLGVEEWTNTQLAQALPIAPSSISRTVTKLVDKGLIQRRRLLSDRRVVHSNVDPGGDGADAGPAPARPGIRRRALRERQRRRDGGLYFRHLNNHGELCCPAVIEGLRNLRLEQSQYRSCSITTQAWKEEQRRAGRRSAGSRSLGLPSRRSGGPAAVIRRHKKFGLFFFVVAVVLGLATAAGSFQGSPAHAQTVATPTIAIATDQATVYEGGLAVFRLTLHGGQSGPIDVQVKTWESDRINATERVHDVHFSSGSRFNTLSVLAYIDAQRDVGVLNASVLPSTDGSYQVDAQDSATVDVLDVRGTNAPAGLTAIGLWAGAGSVGEGWSHPIEFRLDRYGETSDPLTVGVRIDDPQGTLRGNHWDPPPVLPTQVEFAAGSTSEDLFILVPDDQRYLQGASFKVVVLPSTEYLIRGSGTLGFKLVGEYACKAERDGAGA